MPVRGPRRKVVRRLGTQLPGLTRKTAEAPAAPGPGTRTGPSRPRRRPSAQRLRLEEKQKVRFNYGITERQMERYLDAARKLPGKLGENLLLLLERRLDNVVFRLGFAPTIPAARQLVSHGHVRVGGERVDRPAYLVEVGDEISLTPSATERPAFREIAEGAPALRVPSYLRRDPQDLFSGRVVSLPARSDVPFPVRESLIVEYYAR